MDWNKPPTDEFAMLTDNTRYPLHWMTMLKSVLNDYWMDNPNRSNVLADTNLQHFIHKIYYCWYQTMRELHPEELE